MAQLRLESSFGPHVLHAGQSSLSELPALPGLGDNISRTVGTLGKAGTKDIKQNAPVYLVIPTRRAV